MNRWLTHLARAATLAALLVAHAEAGPRVALETSHGTITLELDEEKAPVSVANFLEYVSSGFYTGTVFHRVIPHFMIQGGGFTTDYQRKETGAPIENEAKNGLKNTRGAIAMARTGEPHSATAQFFINTVDNGFLDYPGQDGWGYAVFGRVVDGMEVVDRIRAVPTGNHDFLQNVPLEPVVITGARVVE